MALALAIAGFLAALGASIAAVRAHRATERLALEMVQLRDRLAAAERAYRRAARAPTAEAGDERTAVDAAWTTRVMDLESRLRAAMEREAVSPATDAGADDARSAVRAWLRAAGYERVAVLEAYEDGSLLVEAERGGATSKGRAELLPDGSVRFDAISSVRAFP